MSTPQKVNAFNATTRPESGTISVPAKFPEEKVLLETVDSMSTVDAKLLYLAEELSKLDKNPTPTAQENELASLIYALAASLEQRTVPLEGSKGALTLEQKSIQPILSANDLEQRFVVFLSKADGDCLFHSLEHYFALYPDRIPAQLPKNKDRSQNINFHTIRHYVVDYIFKNMNKFTNSVSETDRPKLEDAYNLGNWNNSIGDMMPYAAAVALGLNIIIFQNTNGMMETHNFKEERTNPKYTVFLERVHGNHFNLLISRQELINDDDFRAHYIAIMEKYHKILPEKDGSLLFVPLVGTDKPIESNMTAMEKEKNFGLGHPSTAIIPKLTIDMKSIDGILQKSAENKVNANAANLASGMASGAAVNASLAPPTVTFKDTTKKTVILTFHDGSYYELSVDDCIQFDREKEANTIAKIEGFGFGGDSDPNRFFNRLWRKNENRWSQRSNTVIAIHPGYGSPDELRTIKKLASCPTASNPSPSILPPTPKGGKLATGSTLLPLSASSKPQSPAPLTTPSPVFKRPPSSNPSMQSQPPVSLRTSSLPPGNVNLATGSNPVNLATGSIRSTPVNLRTGTLPPGSGTTPFCRPGKRTFSYPIKSP
jgi:hypothetical protein